MRITVVASEKQNQPFLQHMLQSVKQEHDISFHVARMLETTHIVATEHPHLLILIGLCEKKQDLQAIEQMYMPGLVIFLICTNQTPDFLIEAMRVGVREVLPAPADPESLKAAIIRIEQKSRAARAPKGKGRLLAFIGCKGGSGTTFIASNLAYALAANSDKRVAFIDLDRQFGDALYFVSDQSPLATLPEVTRDIQRLDTALLASSMVQVTSNFYVLAAGENPEQGLHLTPEHIDALLKLAISQYDFVIVDLGRNLDAITMRALDEADLIHLVLQATLPGIRGAQRLFKVLHEEGYTTEKIHLVINRYDKKGEISQQDVERALGLKTSYFISGSFKSIVSAINKGVPLNQLDNRDPVSKELGAWAQSMLPQLKPPKESWLRQLRWVAR